MHRTSCLAHQPHCPTNKRDEDRERRGEEEEHSRRGFFVESRQSLVEEDDIV